MLSVRIVGPSLIRSETRRLNGPSTHEPPRNTFCFPAFGPRGFSWLRISYGAYPSPHHSQTLPNISHSPSDEFPFGKRPTGVGWYHVLLIIRERRVIPPRITGHPPDLAPHA